MAAPTSPPKPSRDDDTRLRVDGSPANRADPPPGRINESSPLLSDSDSLASAAPRRAAPPRHHDETQESKSLWFMTMLTISVAGLQVAWSVEFSNGSPYLLSLGLIKSLMALVWIAGPLTGSLVVPYVGILSDNCRLPWGKRRPFMIGGTVATVASLLFLSWTREICTGILGLFGADPASQGVKVIAIIAAVVGIYVLDIAINTVQAAIRALIVDCAPAHQQELANAMSSRLTGIGNIIGFAAGYVHLPDYLWFFGDTQFKVLCAIACIFLSLTIALSTSVVHERDPRREGSARKTPGIVFFCTIFRSIKRLPPQTKRVCEVQFFAWVGFFPLLFYTSSYIGEIYVQPYLEKNPHMTPGELEALYEQATRIGTFALLINAIVSLSTNVFLPFFIAPSFDSRPFAATGATGSIDTPNKKHGGEDGWLAYLQIPGFTLRRAWLSSLVLFAVTMFCTPFVRSVEAATVLIGLAGITWAMALWAPWAIISAEVGRRDALLRTEKLQLLSAQGTVERDDDASPYEASPSEATYRGGGGAPPDEVDQAGVILGIHNMAIAVPQIIATVGSSVIFKIWQKPRGTPGDRSIATVMALGGLCVLVSACFAARIRDDGDSNKLEKADEEAERGALSLSVCVGVAAAAHVPMGTRVSPGTGPCETSQLVTPAQ